MARRKVPQATEPSLSPEKALPAFRTQLARLAKLKGRTYSDAENDESEWTQFTQSLIVRTFGDPSPNISNFHSARWAGEHYIRPGGMPPQLLQSNFEKRIQAFGGLMKSCIAELELLLPESDITGAYEPGDEYTFYKDLKSILTLASTEIFVVDNFLDSQLFDVYFEGVDAGISVRVLTDELRGGLVAVAQKYSRGRNFELRTSQDVHDRVVFVDNRCWVVGQSIKDAAKKKPTYIVEHTFSTMRPIYDAIWAKASPQVKG